MGPAEQQLFAAQLWIRALTGRTSWSGLGETRPSSRVRVPRGRVAELSTGAGNTLVWLPWSIICAGVGGLPFFEETCPHPCKF